MKLWQSVLIGVILIIGVIAFHYLTTKPVKVNIIENNSYIDSIKARAVDHAFNITERTEYGLLTNIVYITITENLGKNQIINISSIFKDSPLTNKITYKDIYMNQSYLSPIYISGNISIGKYSTTNSSNSNGTIKNYYYASNGSLMRCDFVLGDKSCMVYSMIQIGNNTLWDYLPLPAQKSKIVVGGISLEFKNGGIPIAKDSTIQLKWTYDHPLAVPKNKPTSLENKYDIVASSEDGGYVGTLDPSWWNVSWGYKKKIDFAGAMESDNSSVILYVNITSNMNSSCGDLRFLNGSENSEFTNYWIQNFNATTCKVYVQIPNNDSIFMYYGNPNVTTTGARSKVAVTDVAGVSITGGSSVAINSTYGVNITTNHKLVLIEVGAVASATPIESRVYTAMSSGALIDSQINTTLTNLIYQHDLVLNNNSGYTMVLTSPNQTFQRRYHGSAVTYPVNKFNVNYVWGVGTGLTLDNDWYMYNNITSIRISTPAITFESEEAPSNLNVPTITFNSQTPSDITNTNAMNVSVILQYTISHITNPIDTTQTNLFWLTNGTHNKNFTQFVNGSIINMGFTSNGVIKSNVTSIWNFTLGDNIYPATYLLNLSIFENSIHSTFNLTTDNTLIKALVLNMTNSTTYNLLEYMVSNMTSSVASLRIYYCNNTYTNGNIDSSNMCGLVANTLNTQGINHTENQSQHWLSSIVINTTVGTIGGVKITPTGYFILRGRTGGWSSYYVSPIAQTSATQTSSNTGSSWADLSGTLDYHLHQFSDDEVFNYYVCSNSTGNGIYNCSTTRSDSLNLSASPPSPPIVFLPANTTYSYLIPINYTASASPIGYNITYYNISLYNADDTFNQTIIANNSLNLGYVWNNTNITLGSFNVHVWATDSGGFKALGESAIFSINASFNSTTTLSSAPGSPINYGATSTFSCANDKGLDTILYIDGVDMSSQKGIAVVRSAGTHIVNCTANDVTNIQGSSQQINYVINKIYASLGLSSAPSDNENYGTLMTITGSGCPAQLTCTLNENGNPVSNPKVATLNAGLYNYNYTTLGNTNYSASSVGMLVTINKINPPITLSISPSTDIINGTQSTATGAGCPDATCVLYRDGIIESNPETTILPIGTYHYNYSYPGSTNYNPFSVSSTLVVNPTGFGGNNGSMTFTQTNLSYVVNFQVPFRFVTRAMMNITGYNNSNGSFSCYQQSANSSTSGDGTCGLNYTGKITSLSFAGIDIGNIYDKNWSSFGYGTVVEGSILLNLNFTKPSNPIGATIEYKAGLNGNIFKNLSIPSSCFDYYPNVLSIFLVSNNAGYWAINCQNSTTTDGETIATNTSSQEIYETAMIWNIDSSGFPSNVNLSQGNNQIYYYSGVLLNTNNTGNFYQITNNFLSGCTYSNGYCIVPITFSSATPGILNYSDVVFESVGVLAGNESFNSNVRETEWQTFNMTNLEYDDNVYTNLDVFFIYRNTTYTATKVCSGMFCNLTKSIDIPLVPSSENHSFLWEIALTNSSGTFYHNTTAQTILVQNITLTNCTSGNITLNFTTYDARNILKPVNATFKSAFHYWLGSGNIQKNFSFEDNIEDSNSFKMCLDPQGKTYYADADIVIGATGYANNYHYLNNATLNNVTSEQRLYLLNSTLSTATELDVINELQNGLPGYSIQIQQYDVGTGTYFLYGMAKTNYAGKDNVYLNWYDTLYKFIVLDTNGNIVANYDPYKVFSTPQTFKIFGQSPFDYLKFNNVAYTLYYNNVTGNVVATFSDPTGKIAAGCLRINQFNYTILYDTCAYTPSGTLSYNLFGQANGTYIATFYMLGSYSSGTDLIIALGEIRSVIFRTLDVKDRGFYAFIIIGIAAMIGLFSPGAAILFGILGFVASAGFGFINLTGVTIVTFGGIFIAFIYIMWKLRS